ncbi:hypothetical protein SCB71_17325 [Herbiconiux sp. KACC 21604]|uniref:hypothetical protein n=1 Tax=unclassified Herbiconiux TaxID=2618217 RepID=UPI001490ABC4|nr:hypothetical protein [Herbiconiux sp. SALV-R1]QJU54841.1 hypothetical protein HL652_15280 [Herbiconiux sp. SALV-R1]WPO85961.1 hypothetical protein SCB71_17325 [Herbiconiux sp. KACC 21604]
MTDRPPQPTAPTRRLERPGALLALVFAVAFALVVGAPFAVNAAIVDPRVHDLPAGGASISYDPPDGSPGVEYRAPGGWFYRESEVDSDRQVFNAPDESATIEAKFVTAGSSARETLSAALSIDDAGLVLGPVDASPAAQAGASDASADAQAEASDGSAASSDATARASAGERLWGTSSDGGVVGVAVVPGTTMAVVVSADGTPPDGSWAVVEKLLASVTVKAAAS